MKDCVVNAVRWLCVVVGAMLAVALMTGCAALDHNTGGLATEAVRQGASLLKRTPTAVPAQDPRDSEDRVDALNRCSAMFRERNADWCFCMEEEGNRDTQPWRDSCLQAIAPSHPPLTAQCPTPEPCDTSDLQEMNQHLHKVIDNLRDIIESCEPTGKNDFVPRDGARWPKMVCPPEFDSVRNTPRVER